MKRIQDCSITRLVVGQMQENCYIVTENKSRMAMIVDPGDDGQYIIDQISKLDAQPVMIVATHGHFDHIMAAYELEFTYRIPFCIHASDTFLLNQMQSSVKHFLGVLATDPPPKITKTLADGELINLGDTSWSVTYSPGHTPGSICLYNSHDGSLFVGDVIFTGGGAGRTDFSYSDKEKLLESIRNILKFPENTWIYSGHGEPTTVGVERKYWNGI